MKKQKYRTPRKRQPFFTIVKGVVRPFVRCKVVYLGEKFPDKCIILANHSAKSGPMALEVRLNHFSVKWGAHEMLGNYRSRYRYLKDVLYLKKLGVGKFRATVSAAFLAIFSKMIYKGMKVIGTYPDARVRRTISNSIKVLDAGFSITIFPEYSDEGYKDVLPKIFPGFVMLCDQYYKKTGEDVPVFPVYYSKKYKKIIIGHPMFVHKLREQGLGRSAIADRFKDAINGLYFKYVLNKDESDIVPS